MPEPFYLLAGLLIGAGAVYLLMRDERRLLRGIIADQLTERMASKGVKPTVTALVTKGTPSPINDVPSGETVNAQTGKARIDLVPPNLEARRLDSAMRQAKRIKDEKDMVELVERMS